MGNHRMRTTEKYKIAYKHVAGDLSQRISRKKQFHQALALVGENLSNSDVQKHWNAIQKGGIDYADFCNFISTLPKVNMDEKFTKFFGEEMNKRDVKQILVRSDAEFSSKRIEAFLDEIFGDEENIKTSRFLTKFNLLQNCVIDNIVDGKFKPMAETLVPQFTVEVGAADGITDTAGVEPDATKKGAFFFVDNACHRFEMTLTSSSSVTINLSLNKSDLNFNFILFKKNVLEATGVMLLNDENFLSASWTGDLTKGTYTIVPFPLESIRTKKSGKSWVQIAEKDRHGELRFSQAAKAALIKTVQLFDTSGNGTIDKNELEQFQMRTEDIEQFDEELWNIVKSNFEVNEDSELTTRGFITMHEAQLQQEGEEEIRTLFSCLGFSPALEPINNCLVKIDVFCPESRVELTAKPITKNIEMGPLLKDNSEPLKVDNLPPRLSVYQFTAPSFACLLIDNPAGIEFKATTKSENAHCNDSLQWQKNGPIHFLLTAGKDFA